MKAKLLFLSLISLLIIPSCTIESNYQYEEADKYSEYSEPLDFDNETLSFKKLTVGWLSGTVNIVEGEDFHVQESNENGEYYPLYYYQKDDELKIQFCKSGLKTVVTDNIKKTLEITIPQSIDYIDLNLVASTYNVSATTLKDLNVNIVSGSGEIRLNSLENFSFNGVSGNITLKLASTLELKNITIEIVSGNANLYLSPIRGYILDFSSVSGSVNKEFIEGNDTSLNKFKIKYESVSGNLNICSIEE